MLGLKLTDRLVDRVANFAFGSCGIAFSATAVAPVAAWALPVLLGAGTIMGLALAARQHHAVDDESALGRIRNKLASEWLADQSFGWAEAKEIETACAQLDEHLKECMLSPKELAEAAADSEGRKFPEKAATLVLNSLVNKTPPFPSSPVAIEFARAVITRAFEAAVEDEAYFRKFEPHLLIETARIVGQTFGVVEKIADEIEQLPEKTARAVIDAWERGGHAKSSLSPATIVALARRLPGASDNPDAMVMDLIRALDAAEEVTQRSASAHTGTVTERMLKGDLDGAATEAEAAFAQWTKEEAERAGASLQSGLNLLDAAIAVDVARGNANAAALKELNRIALVSEFYPERFVVFFERISHYLNVGRRSGARIDLLIAAKLVPPAFNSARDDIERGTLLDHFGVILKEIGDREFDVNTYRASAASLRQALIYRTREREPRFWAMTQFHLGNTLLRLANHERGTVCVEDAISAFLEAHEEFKLGDDTKAFAQVCTGLGSALSTLGQKTGSAEKLLAAIDAHRTAIAAYRSANSSAQEMSISLGCLGNAIVAWVILNGDLTPVPEAVQALRAAIEATPKTGNAQHWASFNVSLGNALVLLAMDGGNPEALAEAIDALHSSLDVFETGGLMWAAAKVNLAQALLLSAENNENPIEVLHVAQRHALEAEQAFEKAGADAQQGMAERLLEETRRQIAALTQ